MNCCTNPNAFRAHTRFALLAFRYTIMQIFEFQYDKIKEIVFEQGSISPSTTHLICPVCVKLCELPAGDPSSLPTNVYAVHMVQIKNGKKEEM